MDTRLKKTHKLTTLLITLVVLIPAFLITALYPRMERAVNERREEYKRLESEITEEETGVHLTERFPNYAVEATYYMYGEYLQQKGKEVDFSIMEQYDWVDDYDEVVENTEYYAEFEDEKEESNPELELAPLLNGSYSTLQMREEMEKRGLSALLVIHYDKEGRISKVQTYSADGVRYDGNTRARVTASQEQYEENTEYYNYEYEDEIDSSQIVPKNMKAIFAVNAESCFISDIYGDDGFYYDTSSVQLYLEEGALAVILIFAALVALAAFLLPLVKKLETGWERPFCISFEGMLFLMGAGFGIAVFMYEFMCVTSRYELAKMIPSGSVEFLGFQFGISQVYYGLLVLNFIGWAVAFCLEYIVAASVRQFFCKPVYYIKNRVWGVRFVRWCVKKVREFLDYVTGCELGEDLHKRLLMVVGANGLLVLVMCFGWFFGAIGCIAYTIVSYVLLRQKMEQVQNDYEKVKDTVHDMAEGQLSREVPEDLGLFQGLGEELLRVKDGFAKAVSEEAKSQSMKTELITNVSHDLKTPLTAIITYVDLLGQEQITEEERKSYIEILGKKSQRLKVLIEDLFEVSKAQSGNVKLNQMNVDIVNLMKQVRTEMEDKIADSSVTFRWDLPENKVMLYLDGQKTYRVFENLLNNILKYAMPDTRAYIDIVETGSEVQVMFRNISKAELDFDVQRLTDRFVRGDAARNSEGSGLGLAIAKSFVELQGGQFQIEVDKDLFKVVLKWEK